MHLCCSPCCSHAGLEELPLQRLSASVVASLRRVHEGSAPPIPGSTKKQLRRRRAAKQEEGSDESVAHLWQQCWFCGAGAGWDCLCDVGLAEGRTEFLNGCIVPKGFLPGRRRRGLRRDGASVAPLAGDDGAGEPGAGSEDLLLAVQGLLGFRSFKKAVAVDAALRFCAQTRGGGYGGLTDGAEELCALVGPYVFSMTDVEALVVVSYVFEHWLAEHMVSGDEADSHMDEATDFCQPCGLQGRGRLRVGSPGHCCPFVPAVVPVAVASVAGVQMFVCLSQRFPADCCLVTSIGA